MFIECSYHGNNFAWYTVCPQDLPEALSINTIKCFLEVNEVNIQGNIPLDPLLYDVLTSKNLIYAASTFPKPCLFLSQLKIQDTVDPLEEDSAEDLARDGQKCYASPVVAVAEVTLHQNPGYKTLTPVFGDGFLVSDLSKEISKHHGGCDDICLE